MFVEFKMSFYNKFSDFLNKSFFCFNISQKRCCCKFDPTF
ncbi:unnamed protein product [Brassica napus]|uniref:(rape) hypothetical protein n=1 Tax=Brassica napus TaxID=3708 RepID=A0A816JJ47_BRANA|nr:unnamed protein product [Brassica napus]